MLRLKPLLIVPFFFAASVFAMSFSSLVRQAEVVRVNAVAAVTSTAVSVTTTVRGFAANDPYQIKKLDVPKATYMTRLKAGMGGSGGLKGLVKANAWYAAWFASVAAAGWAIDELTDQVTQKDQAYIKGKYWESLSCGSYAGSACMGSTAQEACARAGVYRGASYGNYDGNGGCSFSNGGGQVVQSLCYGGQSFPASCGAGEAPSTPVTDQALFDSLAGAMTADPTSAAQAFMGSDGRVYPDIFPDTTPYVPGVAQTDEEALDWYLRGLAQSTNPNAPYYVAPEKLAAIAAQAAAIQQAQTPEGQVAAMNDAMGEPLTQAQLDESLKKQEEAAAKDAETIAATDTSPITDAFENSGTKDEFDKLKERVTDPSKMPALPDLPATSQVDLPSHTPCRTITVNIWNGVLTFPNPDQCQKLEQVKTGIGYLMYILTALGIIFELYRRVE